MAPQHPDELSLGAASEAGRGNQALEAVEPVNRAEDYKGKAVTSQNALVHGLRSAQWLEERLRVNDMLRECRMRLKQVCRRE
jgi:hypothetical protein